MVLLPGPPACTDMENLKKVEHTQTHGIGSFLKLTSKYNAAKLKIKIKISKHSCC